MSEVPCRARLYVGEGEYRECGGESVGSVGVHSFCLKHLHVLVGVLNDTNAMALRVDRWNYCDSRSGDRSAYGDRDDLRRRMLQRHEERLWEADRMFGHLPGLEMWDE